MSATTDKLSRAISAHQRGDLSEAETLYRDILSKNPNHPDSLHLLGWISRQKGDLEMACTMVEKAIRQQPTCPSYHATLGKLRMEQGEMQAAQQCYRKALTLNPAETEALLGLAGWYEVNQDWEQAIQHCQQAIAANPQHIESHETLASLYLKKGDPRSALQAYQAILALQPKHPRTFYNIGILFLKLEEIPQAVSVFQMALALDPNYAEAHYGMGQALQMLNRTAEAVRCYEEAFAISNHPAYQIKAATALPGIYASQAEVADWRAQYAQRLQGVLDSLGDRPLSVGDPLVALGSANFYLAYQGENDRTLQEAFARLIRRMPGYESPDRFGPKVSSSEKPRIGFMSRHFNQGHTIGKLIQGILNALSRQRFEVVLFGLDDATIRENPLQVHDADTVLWLPPQDLERAAAMVAEASVDVLFYTDIGMELATYLLAFHRLAPVQCMWWGHPVTSGIDTIDYFISSTLFEEPAAQAHYTEALVLLEGMPTCYARPVMTGPAKTRQDFGLDTAANLYICPQSLFKLHPDFDEVLAGILRQDPQGRVVLIRGNQQLMEPPLTSRWQQTMPDVAHRIDFLEKLSYQEFLSLVSLADVMLDPLHFGGGNTSLEAFAFGTPIVTCPPPYLRGRVTAGFYHRMGYEDLVVDNAQQYVEVAVRLGTDPTARQQARDRILGLNHLLFEQTDMVENLEDFFLSALQKWSENRHNEGGSVSQEGVRQ